jgi:hypothetical protein
MGIIRGCSTYHRIAVNAFHSFFNGEPMVETAPSLEFHVQREARASLVTFLGEAEGARVWQAACEACNLESEETTLSLDALEAIARQLKISRGPVALVGHSLSIQARTYQMLERTRRLQDFLKGGKP